jgi:phage-related baseplate assembly protein
MPANLGVIAKAYSQPAKISQYQPGELPTILDLYVLSYDANKKLRTASQALKRNLQTYLSQYRMINDAIKIKDAFIVNIGVEFELIVLPNFNNNLVLTNCIDAITLYFDMNRWQINQPIILKDLFVLLDKIEGVQTVQDVRVINKAGAVMGYSDYAYDVYGATYKRVVYPSIDPMIFELKYPDRDIKGRVVPL